MFYLCTYAWGKDISLKLKFSILYWHEITNIQFISEQNRSSK